MKDADVGKPFARASLGFGGGWDACTLVNLFPSTNHRTSRFRFGIVRMINKSVTIRVPAPPSMYVVLE